MKIEFGVVSKYFADRGFGFVTQTFSGFFQKEVFFHIKSIRRARADLVELLNNGQALERAYFWYEIEATPKGDQVRSALRHGSIREQAAAQLPTFTSKVEEIWHNEHATTLPVWLPTLTLELLGASRLQELEAGRVKLEEQRRVRLEAARERARKQAEERKLQEAAEEGEFQQLLAEMRPLAFTHSSQVSRHIVQNKLGCRYRNISGIVTMEESGTSWDFKGGFPPKIYARLCSELGLGNGESGARPVGFKSFKDLAS